MGSAESNTATGEPHRTMAACAALVAFSAFAGSIGLATGTLEMGSPVNERLPFASPVVGGAALALLVAGPFALLAVAALRGLEQTDLVAFVAGSVLIGWIAVEVAFIREFSPLQPLLAAVGLAFAVVGYRGWRREQPTGTTHTTAFR